MRSRIALLLVTVFVAIAVAGCVTGFDPGMQKRCYFNSRWSYTPDCPGLPAGAPHWGIHTPFDGERYVGLHDITTGFRIFPNTPFQVVVGRFPGINGWALDTRIESGVYARNLDAHEVNLAVVNRNMNSPLRGLRSSHSVALVSKSGTSSAEYGVKFKGPNGQTYVLNYVLVPFGSNVPPVDDTVIFHGCTWHCGQADQSNVIKLNSRKFGAPRIDNGMVNVTIEWERLLRYVHDRGWWRNVTPDVSVFLAWFQLQTWGVGSDHAGSIRTIQGNWTMSYP